MQFKRSAGVFVAGVTLMLAGPLLSLIVTTDGLSDRTQGATLPVAAAGAAQS